MVIVWTEAFASFTPVGASWQNYDIYTNNSVPKGAVALIVCANALDAGDKVMGVRTDGSSLSRYAYSMHEAESGGVTTQAMFVTVDASTGYIETYCQSTTSAIFYLLGYFTGVTFTETIQELTISSTGWQDSDLTAYGTDARVWQVHCWNSNSGAATTVGVRTNGSSLDRYVTIHECEGGAVTPGNGYSVCVKSDTNGVIETYVSSTTDGHIFLLGYFDATLDYVEKFQTMAASGSDSTWTDWDLTAYLDEDGRIGDFVLTHQDTGSETDCGARINGSGLSRYIQEHEAETNGFTGFQCITQTDASGIVEVYCQDISESGFHFVGYFVPGSGATTYTKTFTFDALLQGTRTKAFSFDSLLKRLGSKTFTLDGLLKLAQTKTYSFDALLQKAQTKGFTLDGYLQQTLTKAYTFDAYLTGQGTKALTFDAWLQQSLTKSCSFDAWLSAVQSKAFNFDSLLKYILTKDFTFDALTKLEQSKVFSFDALTKLEQALNFTYDGWLQQELSKTFDFDAITISLSGKTFNYDAWLQSQFTKAYTFDALLMRQDTKTLSFDGWLQQELSKSFSFDSWLQATLTKTFLYDALLQGNYTASFSFDSLLQQTNPKTFSLDALLTGTLTKGFTLDALLSGGNEANFTFDAQLQQQLTRNFLFDALLQAKYNKDFTFDGYLQSLLTGTRTLTFDALLSGNFTVDFTFDAILDTLVPITPPRRVGRYYRAPEQRKLSPELLLLLRRYLEVKLNEHT